MSTNFISVWNTEAVDFNDIVNGVWTLGSGPNQIRLPLKPGGIYNFTVDWGDGTTSVINTWNHPSRTHTYSFGGLKTVTITGVIEGWGFYPNSFDNQKLISISDWGTLKLNSPGAAFSEGWFNGCENLTSIPALDTTGMTSLSRAFVGCNSLTSFPLTDTSNITDFSFAWWGCSSLTSFPSIDTSSGNNFISTWRECSALTSFPLINTENATSLSYTWGGCSNLTSFPLIDTSNVTDFSWAWKDCKFASFPLIDTSNGTQFFSTWESCNYLTSFPLLDFSSGINFVNTWKDCGGLTSFPLIDTSSGVDFTSTWENCGLWTFPLIDTSEGTTFINTWKNCFLLTSFPLLNVSNGTNFFSTWQNCSELTSFPLLNVSSGTNFSNTWKDCVELTSFPLLNVSNGTNFFATWQNCNKLTSFPLLNFSNGVNFDFTWNSCAALINLPVGFGNSLANLETAIQCFTNVTLSRVVYSRLLVEIESVNSNNDVIFWGGNSKYNDLGLVARNKLINDHSWVIEDGGYLPNTINNIPIASAGLIASKSAVTRVFYNKIVPTGRVNLNGVSLFNKISFNDIPIFPLQIINSPSISVSNPIDVSTKQYVVICVNYCNNIVENINSISIKIEAECNSEWVVISSWEPAKSATVVSTITNSVPVGSTSLTVSSNSSIRKNGQLAFIRHQINASPLNLSKSEFVKFRRVNGTSITLLDPVKYNHTTIAGETAFLYSSAYNWMVKLDVSSITKIRMVVDASQSSQQFVFESYLVLY